MDNYVTPWTRDWEDVEKERFGITIKESKDGKDVVVR